MRRIQAHTRVIQDVKGGYRMAKLRGNRAVSYSRVSSNKDEQKTSIESQKAYYLEKFSCGGLKPAPVGVICSSRGEVTVTNNGIYADEGISGTSLKHRKAFNTMIADAKRGKFDIIFVKSVSRFARSSIDGKQIVEELREIGVAVVFEDVQINTITSPNDFTLGILFEVAEEESRAKGSNVKWGIKQRILRGEYINSLPLGYGRTGGKAYIDEEQAKIVRFIFDEYTEKGNSLLGIANACMQLGYKTSTGNDRWRTTGVQRLIRNEIYKGLIRQGKTESTTFRDGGNREVKAEEDTLVRIAPELAIISEEQWQRAQNIMAERSINEGKRNNRYSSTHTFSSLIFCDCCGSAYTRRLNNRTRVNRGTDTNKLYQWCCCERDLHGDKVCTKPLRLSISEKIVEKAVRDEIAKLREDKEYLTQLFLVHELVVNGFPKDPEEVAELTKQKDELSGQLKKIMFRATMDDVGSGIYDDMLKEIEVQLKEVQQELLQIQCREDNIRRDKAEFDKYIKELDAFDVDNITSASLKRIFNKVWVVDTMDYLEPDKASKHRRGLVFDFKFFRMSHMKLIEKALELNYPYTLKLDIVLV